MLSLWEAWLTGDRPRTDPWGAVGRAQAIICGWRRVNGRGMATRARTERRRSGALGDGVQSSMRVRWKGSRSLLWKSGTWQHGVVLCNMAYSGPRGASLVSLSLSCGGTACLYAGGLAYTVERHMFPGQVPCALLDIHYKLKRQAQGAGVRGLPVPATRLPLRSRVWLWDDTRR